MSRSPAASCLSFMWHRRTSTPTSRQAFGPVSAGCRRSRPRVAAAIHECRKRMAARVASGEGRETFQPRSAHITCIQIRSRSSLARSTNTRWKSGRRCIASARDTHQARYISRRYTVHGFVLHPPVFLYKVGTDTYHHNAANASRLLLRFSRSRKALKRERYDGLLQQGR